MGVGNGDPGQTSDSLGEEERGTLDVSLRGEDGFGRALCWRAVLREHLA